MHIQIREKELYTLLLLINYSTKCNKNSGILNLNEDPLIIDCFFT